MIEAIAIQSRIEIINRDEQDVGLSGGERGFHREKQQAKDEQVFKKIHTITESAYEAIGLDLQSQFKRR